MGGELVAVPIFRFIFAEPSFYQGLLACHSLTQEIPRNELALPEGRIRPRRPALCETGCC